MKHRAILGAAVIASAVWLPQTGLASGYTETQYPILLVHGLFGFDHFLGANYFYKVPGELSRDGARVFVSTVSAANSNEVRGEQLLAEVRRILAQTGAAKINLIGHSQGSPTARYVAAVRPDLVASVTSVGGVNAGSRVADIVRKVAPPGSVSESVAAAVAGAFVKMLTFATGSDHLPQNTIAALDGLTTQGLATFNAKYPAGVPHGCGEGAHVVNGVRYYAWGGSSPVTNVLDPLDGPIGLLSLAHGVPNDGLVDTCSQRLGQVIRVDYKMNHLDQINGFFGITHLSETSPLTVYRQHANRLKNAGL
ncbi:triacylglycerol lipase [Chitinivorax tropicus]|uniref:Triacylglycerol lipase n=1 Tax=Chitinivorax tropicus TaxID=714531 RepID=A0A840MPW2_9PROT|nr:triacylglycerol lipase [Chitinivorax tropicus]